MVNQLTNGVRVALTPLVYDADNIVDCHWVIVQLLTVNVQVGASDCTVIVVLQIAGGTPHVPYAVNV